MERLIWEMIIGENINFIKAEKIQYQLEFTNIIINRLAFHFI